MNPEVEAPKRFFAAVNRNDMQAMTRDFDPNERLQPTLDSYGACR
jgi:hypothetical protein